MAISTRRWVLHVTPISGVLNFTIVVEGIIEILPCILFWHFFGKFGPAYEHPRVGVK